MAGREGGGRLWAAARASYLKGFSCPVVAERHGLNERTVLIEFDSVAQAIATHDSPAYKEALAALADGVERDLRIVEGA